MRVLCCPTQQWRDALTSEERAELERCGSFKEQQELFSKMLNSVAIRMSKPTTKTPSATAPIKPPASDNLITVTINGKEITATADVIKGLL